MAFLYHRILLSCLIVGAAVVSAQQCPPGYAPLPPIPGSVCFGALPDGLGGPTSISTVTVISTSVVYPGSLTTVASTTASGASTTAPATSTTTLPTPVAEIAWEPCPYAVDSTAYTLDCAIIQVPLDYTLVNGPTKRQDSSNILDLQLVRAKSLSSTPRNQSIILNFGGPGESGILAFIGGALVPKLWKLTGADYDLISFDPRGVGNTIPFVCNTEGASTKKKLKRGTVRRQSAQQLAEYETSVHDYYQLANTCLQTNGNGQNLQYARLLGTAFVARDIIEIVDQLNEDGMLRYYGFSYGTTLGATIAAMFPERIDKMVLDGCDDPNDYYHSSGATSFSATDGAFSGFFEYCARAPGTCKLADPNTQTTGPQLQAQFNNFLSNLTEIQGPQGSITRFRFISEIFGYLYKPWAWETLASYIEDAYDYTVQETLPPIDDVNFDPDDDDDNASSKQRRSELKHRADATNSAKYPIPTDNHPLRAISGSETPEYSNIDSNVLTEWYKQYSAELGPTFLDSQLQLNVMSDATWPIRAAEIFEGPFGVTTHNPILFVGNTWDPITPYTNAAASSALFPGSGLIHQNSYGHCSISQSSTCTNNLVNAYWQSGQLPSTYGAFCEPDSPPFTTASTKRAMRKRRQDSE